MNKVKRMLLAMVAALMTLSMVPAMAFAAELSPQADPVVFTLYKQYGEEGTPVLVKGYTQSELEALVDITTDSGYLYYKNENWQVAGTKNAVSLDAILANNKNMLFRAGDQIIVTDTGDGTTQPLSMTFGYQDIVNGKYFYPATGPNATVLDGVSEVKPAIAITSGAEAVTGTASQALATAATENEYSNRFLIGLSESNYLAQNAAGKRFVSGVDSITVVYPDPNSPFKVYTQIGEDSSTKSLRDEISSDELLAMSKTNPLGFLLYKSTWQVHATNSYVPLADLLDAADVSLNPGESIKVMASDGFSAKFTYDQIQAGKYFYPATTADARSTDGASEVGAVLALKWGTSTISATAGQAVSTALENLTESKRFYIGLSETDYNSNTAAGNRFVTDPVEVTVFKTNEARPLAGETRIDTAIASAREAFPNGAETAFIAYGFNYPDALSATSLAGMLDAPILLSDTATLSDGVDQALADLGVKKVVIVGGTSVISADVEAALKTEYGEANVTRLAGDSRYSTNLAVYDYGLQHGTWNTKAVVASGTNFPDALSMAPYAFASSSPIFLVDPTTGFQADIATAIADAKTAGELESAVIAGGTNAVSVATETSLEQTFTADKVDRISGVDRYGTSAAIADWLVSNAGFTWDGTCIASGVDFPDSLTGSVVAAKKTAPLLLVSSSNTSILDKLETNKSTINHIYFLGGVNAVSQAIRDLAYDKLGWS